jgi:hypothetical protein
MNNSITESPYPFHGADNRTTHTDYSSFPAFKQPTLEEQITALRKEIDELRQEITVLKTLIPPPEYIYGIANASDKITMR